MCGWARFSGRRAGRKVFVFASVLAIKSSEILPLGLLRGHLMATLSLSVQVQRDIGGREREREREGEREKSMG